MTVESHLAELQRRHHVIDAKIADEARRPASDGLELAALKRQKLTLKDEIERLRKETLEKRLN
jgi:hypothetical protein